MRPEAAAVARRAAEIVQERGHCKGEMLTEDGRVCLHGAILEAVGEVAWSNPYSNERATLRQQINDALSHVVPFDPTAYSLDRDGGLQTYWRSYYGMFPGAREVNDRPDTDDTDIAKVLLQVADRLDVTP